MLHQFTINVPYKEIDSIVEILYREDIVNFYYEAPIETVVFQNGYTYEENQEAIVELHIYGEVDETKDVQEFHYQLIENHLKIPREQICYEFIDENKWTADFQDIDLGNDWIIAYPDFQNEYHGKHILKFDPQAAFGTGLHGTTQDCLRIILEQNYSDKTVLDLGTGSGILTIGAALKNAKEVTAIDIEPVEREIIFNATLNKVISSINIIEEDILSGDFIIEGKFDWIFINIGADEALGIIKKHQLFDKSKNFIISGVVDWHEKEITQSFASQGFMIKNRLQTDEWVTFYFEK